MLRLELRVLDTESYSPSSVRASGPGASVE